MFYDYFLQIRKKGNVTTLGLKVEQLFAKKHWDRIAKYVGEYGSLLEIGPGYGTFAKLVVKNGFAYEALEANKDLQKRLKKEGINVRRGTAPPLPFKDRSFDFVYSNAVIEHMPTFIDAFQLVQECNRVIKEHGFFALGFPDYVRAGIDYYFWDYSHSFLTTKTRMERLLYDCGFKIRKIYLFTGFISFSPLRILFDTIMLIINNRLTYFFFGSFGLDIALHKIHKSTQATILLIAEKVT